MRVILEWLLFSLYSGSLGEGIWSCLLYSPCQHSLYSSFPLSEEQTEEGPDITDVMQQTVPHRIIGVSKLDKFSDYFISKLGVWRKEILCYQIENKISVFVDSVFDRKSIVMCFCMWEYLHFTTSSIPAPRIKLLRVAAITRKLIRSSLFSYQSIWMTFRITFFSFPASLSEII